MHKRWLLVALLCLLFLTTAAPAGAGMLTTGTYTYLILGSQVDYPVDIVPTRGGYLVPAEILATFGLVPTHQGSDITLKRGPVTIKLELGSDTMRVDDRQVVAKAAPSLINGRLFLPADLLPELGISLDVDGKFVYLTDYLSQAVDGPRSPDFKANWDDHTAERPLWLGGQYAYTYMTVLTRELLADPALEIPWGVRLRLLSLLQSRTLVYTTVRNSGIRAVALDPKQLMLVDDNGRQYDYLNLEVPVFGTVSSLIAPGATRTSVFAFPQVEPGRVTFYHNAAEEIVGTVRVR